MVRYRIECYKPTPDDWYPPFYANTEKLVRVTLLTDFTPEGGLHRVCVWGNDDFGMEYDTPILSKARSLYELLCFEEMVSVELLDELGFVRC